jgi:phosphate uptake regulator
MNEKYQEKLGRLIANTYGIKGHDHQRIGKLIETSYQLLEQEEMRDLREKANQAQWGDEESERRIDIIGSNSNEGLHYD